MPEKNQDRNDQSKSGNQGDSEARLQEELNRESAEGADSIGDVSSNRTLSGSSTWETLPEDSSDAGDPAARKDRTPKNS